MRFFLDTEFVEDGQTIRLLSIGIVAEDGREFYRETFLALDLRRNPGKFDPWLVENVAPYLGGPGTTTMNAFALGQDIRRFAGDSPEFWGYYCDYDWVALCQLYGRMVDLPKDWPMFCLDLKQEAFLKGVELPKQEGAEHHALADARWIRDAHTFLRGDRP